MVFQQEKKFLEFREKHPELRFFQALRAFMDVDKIIVEDNGRQQDTFYWSDLGINEIKFREQHGESN